MIRTKLIELLRHCSKKEQLRFRDYLHSPYFNKTKRLVQLYEILLQYAPEFNDSFLQKENLFAQLFPGQSFNEYKINNDISDILQHLYDFLATGKLLENKARVKHFLMKDLLNRDLPFHLKRTTKKYEKYHEGFPFRNGTFYNQAYHYYDSKDAFFLYRSERFYDNNLQLKSDYLDFYFFITKFKIACDMLTRAKAVKAEYACNLLDKLLQTYRQQKNLAEIPAIRQYYLAYQMLKSPENDCAFFDYKKSLIANQHLFPRQERWTLYNYAINHCIQKINSGENNYYAEIQLLYTLMLDNKIILKNNLLSQWAYKNIVTVGVRIKDFDWTENFIVHYKKYLPKKEQANALAYNMAVLHYEKSEYTLALRQLHNVLFTDTAYHLGAKIIQLKSYFELNETEVLYDLIQAFKKYISRSKDLSDYRKKANDHFLKITRQVYKLKLEKKLMKQTAFDKKMQELKWMIQNTDPLANKSWLEAVIEKLNNPQK